MSCGGFFVNASGVISIDRFIFLMLHMLMARKINKTITPEDIAASKRCFDLWKKKKDEMGINQEQLGELMGVTQSTISSWFHGRTPIGTNALLKFAAVFDVPPTEIRPEFEHGAFSGELSPDTLRIAKKIETLPEGVRQDLERTIDNILNSNYIGFIQQVGRIQRESQAIPAQKVRNRASLTPRFPRKKKA